MKKINYKTILLGFLMIALTVPSAFSQKNLKQDEGYREKWILNKALTLNCPDTTGIHNCFKRYKEFNGTNEAAGLFIIKKDKRAISDISNKEDELDNIDGYLMFIFLYALNPISLVNNGKVYWGFTKELTLGFGRLGQYRSSVEYSILDWGNAKSTFRAGLKYDILLKKGARATKKNPAESSVITLGGGYYTDFDNYGYYPEVSYGYSFRNNKYLIYPSIKIRYTFVNNDTGLFDLSCGLVFGFANPF